MLDEASDAVHALKKKEDAAALLTSNVTSKFNKVCLRMYSETANKHCIVRLLTNTNTKLYI